jgi:osmotically-inducible protein OsmY
MGKACRIILLAGVTALFGCASDRECGVGNCAGDAQITAQVHALFDQHPALQPPNLIYVKTINGVVYLTGQVNTDLERENAGSLALQASGAARVVNSIALTYP